MKCEGFQDVVHVTDFVDKRVNVQLENISSGYRVQHVKQLQGKYRLLGKLRKTKI